MSMAIPANLGSAHLDKDLIQNVADHPPQFKMKVSEIDDYFILHKSMLAVITATDKFMDYFSGHESMFETTPVTDKSMKYFSGTATARYYIYDDTQTKIQDEAKEITDGYTVHLSSQKTKYLALTVGPEHTYNSFIRYLQRQRHRILEQSAVIVQREDNSMFQPDLLMAMYPTANVDLRHIYKDIILDEFSESLDVVARREDNWNERGFKKPCELALANAQAIVIEMIEDVVAAEFSLRTPFISSNEVGNVTVVWYKGEHELHLKITDDAAEYVKVWGINIDTEMDADTLIKDNYLPLWEWLLDG